MRKAKSLLAAILMLFGTVGITQGLQAHCIACDGTEQFDGMCYGDTNRQCVDEKSWWQSWVCNNGVNNTADCPVIQQ
ncbi:MULTISPECIES: hypothetical protein [Roseivirga]|uniref:hypothetical protein n=1 Tax=Roseivirga TaxID=290180 RepID=UPI0025795B60|nr:MULTISPECIES: hypothetical protein [Roseivirga]|tara:strand:+ start:298 stop:528 length:231 start_codon:yes stop_codon:yes gene_type:complete